MTDDDKGTDELRQQIRAELAEKKRMSGPVRFLVALGIASPLFLYIASIWHAHHFHDYSDFLHWLVGCFTDRCS